MDTFDYLIIGAGSAGCVLANRLSESGANTVCALEAGPSDRYHPFIHIPAGFIKTLNDHRVNWLYRTEPSEWTGGRTIEQPRGKTLGGSSSINGLVFNRGQRMDFDGWAQRGNRGWGYADVLPYFRRYETRLGAQGDSFRGQEGELVISDIDWNHPLCEAFIEGALHLGIPHNNDYNGERQEGVAYAQRTIHKRRRMSTARAFLHPVRGRKNLTVITHAHATKIQFEGKRATGVIYRKGGQKGALKEIRVRREVLLCGGTVNSPQLLQLSGVGAPELLTKYGIPVVHTLPGVGENLRDHYSSRFTVRVKNALTINERAHGWRLAGEIVKYFTGQPSILSLNPTLVYCFWHSNEILRNADLQLTFTPATYKDGVLAELDDYPGMTCAAWQQRPESTGHIHIRSADPFTPPIIQPNYLSAAEDRQALLAGMRLSRRLLKSAPLAPYYERETFPGEDVTTDDELLDAAKRQASTTYHIMGTCRMGPDSDSSTVVDNTLRVHGLEGLRVVDASIMPTMPSANLNAATVMIAEKASDLILGKPSLEPAVLADVQ